jgi:hypothetical protein
LNVFALFNYLFYIERRTKKRKREKKPKGNNVKEEGKKKN